MFSLDLTPGGAALVERTIRGDAALVPLQVAYELTFWARLPEVGVHLEVDAQRMHEYITKQLEGRGTDNCTTYDFDHTTFSEEALQLSGAVRLTVDNGSGSVPEEVVAELRGYAMDTLKALLQDTFFVPEPPEDPNHPDRLPNHRYFQKDFDKSSMSIRLDLQQRSVVPWKIAPRGTLTTLLGAHGDPDAHIRKVTLDDDFFADLRVEAEVFTDYTGVGHVEVELAYAGRGNCSCSPLPDRRPGRRRWRAASASTSTATAWCSRTAARPPSPRGWPPRTPGSPSPRPRRGASASTCSRARSTSTSSSAPCRSPSPTRTPARRARSTPWSSRRQARPAGTSG
ncbi:hypothetical protein ACFQV2_20720 [Actinokineospora soli]|uniref:Uncharacterized protein n=1 Tax=Actinokineospora soli TaxID=1048753 RepID=A0ABW2TPE4_9PSEU